MTDPGQASEATDPREAGKFSISEDWAATILGLTLLVLAFSGIIPEGLIP